jgi:hypothetical protein
VPADDGFGLDNEKVPAPTVRPGAMDPDPQQAIMSVQPGVRVGTKRNLELVGDDEVLEGDVTTKP